MGWYTDVRKGAKNLVKDYTVVGNVLGGGGAITDAAEDYTVVGNVLGGGQGWDDVTGVTTAKEIEQEQQQAIASAANEQDIGYGRAVDQLSPYADIGGSYLGTLSAGINSGQYVPGSFDYSGTQTGPFDYQGAGQQGASGYQGDPNITSNYAGAQESGFDYGRRQSGDIGYSGLQAGNLQYAGQQQGASDYRGGPEMGSISSFMGDPSKDPGYQHRLSEGLKAVDRQAAMGGRFGGGRTAKELLRFATGEAAQGYADDFARAGQEREAQRFGEQDIYGRGLTALQLKNQAEQSGFGRAESSFDRRNRAEQSNYDRVSTALDRRNLEEQSGYDRSRAGFQDRQYAEESAYGRDQRDLEIQRQIEQDQYGRSEVGLDRSNMAEQNAYDRSIREYGFDVGREQVGYDRQREDYDYEAARLAEDYRQRQDMVGLGERGAMALSNAALGHGTALGDYAIQGGNAAAASLAAQGTTAGNLLNLAGQGAQIYGAL